MTMELQVSITVSSYLLLMYVLPFSYVGDCQLPVACLTFVEEYGPKILRLHLSRNFILHLVNLYDFGLIRPDVIHRTMAKFVTLQNQMRQNKDGRADGDLQLPSLSSATSSTPSTHHSSHGNKYMSPWTQFLPIKLDPQGSESQIDTDDDSQASQIEGLTKLLEADSGSGSDTATSKRISQIIDSIS